jgi:phytoene desaturase
MSRACVVGAGFGGLALAIRLQAAGIETVVVEARDRAGGLAYVWQREGFTFDAGPTMITDPAGLEQLWSLTGHAMAEDVTLLPVSPYYRLSWPDGTTFDAIADTRALHAAVERLAPGELAGYEAFMRYCATAHDEGFRKLGAVPFLDPRSMIKGAPTLARHQAWRSMHSLASSFVKSEKLREALSVHALMIGGNPFTTSAVHALSHTLIENGGVWWAKGGTNQLVAAMVGQFERLGGTVRLGDPVLRIHTLGNRVTEVECQSGWRERFAAVASNADVVHTYRDLLGGSAPAARTGRKLARKRFSPSLFAVHFGVEGSWPGIPHHTVLFGPRYKGLFDDIFDHGVLPRDQLIHLHHPTVSDPGMAPVGKSTFRATIPVAHRGKLPVDWAAIGPMLERRVLDEVGRRLIPDIHDRLVTSFHYTPRDFAQDLNAHLGSAFSLEPILAQSGYFRAHNRDDSIANLYLVGAGTQPGAGIPGVLAGARATARLMLGDLAG